jgi:predicted dehydrogenase
MQLTAEQEQIGKENFSRVVGHTRRDFLKSVAVGGTGLGAAYFGYEAIKGDPVRVGFIGTGDEGNILITQHPPKYMDIVAIADLRPTNRKRAMHGDGNEHRVGLINKLGDAKALAVEQFADHRQLLEAKDRLNLEAVVIAVPLNQHAPLAMECLDAGLHVLSEKLMAHNITECKQLIRKAQDKNLLLAVGHQRHYSVLYDNANKIVEMGLLGDIRHIHAQWHRNNSFPKRDSWRKRIPKDDENALKSKVQDYGFESMERLVNWRLYNDTGGGLMAELGSHQLDACSIFLGKKHPLAVQGYGGRNFYGVQGIGSKDKQDDHREIDDHVYVTLEFPGPHYDAESNPNDICVVTYSSLNTNRLEGYGETVLGSRAAMVVKAEKDALLFKESSPRSAGGLDQRLYVVDASEGGSAVLDAYETTGGSAEAESVAPVVSRGYTEEMEHFCYCVRNGNHASPSEGGLRCNGVVAMGDAIMALTSNLAMKHKKRIVFKEEWFDPDNDLVPETDPDVVGSAEDQV